MYGDLNLLLGKNLPTELMEQFTEGNRVRIDSHDETGPEHKLHDGKHAPIVTLLEDHAEEITGDGREGIIYRVKLDTGERVDF